MIRSQRIIALRRVTTLSEVNHSPWTLCQLQSLEYFLFIRKCSLYLPRLLLPPLPLKSEQAETSPPSPS